MCDLNYGSLVHTALLYIPLAPLFAFPCLGLELNFKSRYFSPAVFLVFFVFFPPIRDNAALHDSSGPLSIFFECGSN